MRNKEREFSKLVKESERLIRIYSMDFEKGNVHNAEDLYQETLIKAFTSFETYEPTFKFASWVKMIMQNNYIDKIRKKRLDVCSMNEFDGTNLFDNITNGDYEGGMLTDQFKEVIDHADKVLPDRLKPTFELWLKQYKMKDIASELDMNLNTVKVYISDARKKIRQTYRQ